MFLILDFTQSLKLALFDNHNFAIKEFKIKKNISEIFILEIEKFFNKMNTNIKKIKAIYIITGPGSFTGVRSALTFAKSLRLITNLEIFGLSKFEFINYKTKINKSSKCILLHFKDNQFFTQTFRYNKPVKQPRLINFDYEKFSYDSQINYIYENSFLEEFLGEKNFMKIKENSCLVEYNLEEIKEIIINNMIDNNDPKPLYISNYY